MKKTIKKLVEVILTIIACTSLILMCAEKPDGGICLPWNLGWMAALAVSSILLDKMGAFDKEEDRARDSCTHLIRMISGILTGHWRMLPGQRNLRGRTE